MFFSRHKSKEQILNVKLNGDLLPWVDKAKHLGNHLSSSLSFSSFSPETKTDLLSKRAILFDKIHQIQQQFGYYDPHLIIKLLSIYATAMYGSTLWELNSEEHFKLNRAWNIAVKMIWDLPYATRTCFLESLSPVPHLESVLLGRYIGFLQNLSQSEHPILTVIFNSTWCDLSSLTGQNVKFLLGKFQKKDLAALIAEKLNLKKLRIHSLKEEDAWKINLIEEISLIKKEHLETSFDEEDLEEILEFICIA